MLTNPFPSLGIAAPGGARSTSQASIGTRLVRSFHAASAHCSEDSVAALRAVATDVVDRLKARGLSRERVVAVVERLLRQYRAAEPASTAPAGAPPRPAAESTVYARLLGWCVRAYENDAWW